MAYHDCHVKYAGHKSQTNLPIVYAMARQTFKDGAEFVRAVQQHLETGESKVALAVRLDFDHQGPSNIGRWLAGKAEPSYRHTMDMLDACGWISVAGRSSNATDDAIKLLRRLRAGEPVPDADVERAAAAVDRTAESALRLAKDLRAQIRSSRKARRTP